SGHAQSFVADAARSPLSPLTEPVDAPNTDRGHEEVLRGVFVPPMISTGPGGESARPSGTGRAAPRTPRQAALSRIQGVPRIPRKRRGPLTPPRAGRELDDAEDRDAILDLVFDFSRQYFDFAALFVMHGEFAEGREADGPGADREAIVMVGAPVDVP